MAGSLSHIVDDETGKFRMDLIENLGDAHEALEECFQIIYELIGGDRGKLNEVLEKLQFPTLEHAMVLGSNEDN
jgi:hypothetical protein